jgi:peptidoglycan-associated lipoprotein
MLKKSLLFIAVMSGFFALTACSTTGTDAGKSSTDASANANDAGVETSGLGDSSSSGDGLSNPNAMVPGANQRYYFDYDKSDVHSSDLPSIKVQAQYLTSHPSASAQIQGNTDIRGSREYNIALGQRRADAVKKVLLLDGTPSKQISTISYGAEKPVALGNAESDYAKNRRDDMVYKSH